MGVKIRFPQDFMVYMDGNGILNSPFPSHGTETGSETNCIHNVGTHEKWWGYSNGDISVLFELQDLGSNIIRHDSAPIHYKRIYYNINQGNPINIKHSCIGTPRQFTYHSCHIGVGSSKIQYRIHPDLSCLHLFELDLHCLIRYECTSLSLTNCSRKALSYTFCGSNI